MCTSPISFNVSKRQRYFNANGLIPTYISVPCGECFDCLSNRRNGYFLRILDEFKRNLNSGGCCVFLTFTYRDEDVPVLTYEFTGEDIVFNKFRGCKSDCFNLYRFEKSDLQTFFNSFRKMFERLGIESPFRYFIVGEYGSDCAFTQRPHYHGLFFLSSAVRNYYNNFNIKGILSFMSDVQRYWHYGIVSASKKGLVVDSTQCASYCSKYVGKGTSLSKLFRFNIFRNFVSSFLDRLFPQDFFYTKSVDSLFRYYLRKSGCRLFVMNSKHFGSGLCAVFNDSIVSSNYEAFSDLLLKGYPVTTGNETFHYRYPKYIVDRCLYFTRTDGSKMLTRFGYEVKKCLYSRYYESFVKEIRKIDRVSFKRWLYLSFDCEVANHYFDFVFDFLSSVRLDCYFLYVNFARGVSALRSSISFLKSALYSDSLPFSDKLDFCFKSLHGYKFLDFEVVDSDMTSFDYLQQHESLYFTFPINHNYELFNYLYTQYNMYCRYTLLASDFEKESETKKISDILNYFNYGF